MIIYYSAADYPFFQESYLLEETNIMLSYSSDVLKNEPMRRFQRLIDSRKEKMKNEPKPKESGGSNGNRRKRNRKTQNNKVH